MIGPGRPGHRRTVPPSLGRGRYTRLPLTRRPPCGTARAYTPSCRGRFGGCSTPRGLPGTTRPRFALQASSVGLQQVTALLQSAPNWPESLVGTGNAIPGFFLQMPSGYLSGTAPSSSSVIQPPSDPSFWTNCVANNTCATLPQAVQYGPYSYQVEYVMFPSGGMTTQINGNEQTQTGNGSGALSVRYYVAFVHAARASGGGLGVTIQAVLEKVMGS